MVGASKKINDTGGNTDSNSPSSCKKNKFDEEGDDEVTNPSFVLSEEQRRELSLTEIDIEPAGSDDEVSVVAVSFSEPEKRNPFIASF
ncbi:MAG: hypothetical protein R2827_10260 [Bdellovibrionales bacterium]